MQSSSALALLPRSTAEFISASDRSHALYRSCIMSASMSLFLVSVDTGRVLEANDVVYQSTGWKPEHVIDRSVPAALHRSATCASHPSLHSCAPPVCRSLCRVLTAPFELFMMAPKDLPPLDDPAQIMRNQHRPLVNGPDGQLVPAKFFNQYLKSKSPHARAVQRHTAEHHRHVADAAVRRALLRDPRHLMDRQAGEAPPTARAATSAARHTSSSPAPRGDAVRMEVE